jgi:predicted amidohydrolase
MTRHTTCARIATVCQNGQFYSSADQNRTHVQNLLDLALANKPDLVCLPETFTTVSVPGATQDLAEPVPGPTIDLISQRAKTHHCYIVCPIKTRRDDKLWNSAIIVDRHGDILGIYDKAQPVTTSADYVTMENGITPGPTPPPVFELDFGRVGIQICFDAGFPESWQALADKGARLVLWPSAYNGGFPLQVYAYLHHFYVVSSVRTDSSRIINPLGQIILKTDQRLNVIHGDINLDYCVCHWDFNHGIPDRIMAKYGACVEIRSDRDSGHFMIEPKESTVTVDRLQQEFGFESTAQYHQRHRKVYPILRMGGTPEPQNAAHRDRSQYAKETRTRVALK